MIGKLTQHWTRDSIIWIRDGSESNHCFTAVMKHVDLYCMSFKYGSNLQSTRWMGYVKCFVSDIDTVKFGKFKTSKEAAMRDAERMAEQLSLDIRDGARAIMMKYGEPEDESC